VFIVLTCLRPIASNSICGQTGNINLDIIFHWCAGVVARRRCQINLRSR
jgi:hypothetical protein